MTAVVVRYPVVRQAALQQKLWLFRGKCFLRFIESKGRQRSLDAVVGVASVRAL
jgi:hypothetical protein